MLKYLVNIKYKILFTAAFSLCITDSYAQVSDGKTPIQKSFIIDEDSSDPLKADTITDEEYVLKIMKKISMSIVNNEKDTVQDSSFIDKIEQEVSKILIRKRKFKSLMFTNAQISELNAALDSFRGGELYLPEETIVEAEEEIEEEVNRKSYIHLASILYSSQHDWVVWLNGEKITNQSNDPNNELYVTSIDKDKINVLWTISVTKWKILLGRKSDDMESKININNQVEAQFTLRPNQTYLLIDDVVVEGYTE